MGDLCRALSEGESFREMPVLRMPMRLPALFLKLVVDYSVSTCPTLRYQVVHRHVKTVVRMVFHKLIYCVMNRRSILQRATAND